MDVRCVFVRVQRVRSLALRDVRRAATGRRGGRSHAQRSAVGVPRLHLRQPGQRRQVHHVHGRPTGGVRAITSGPAGALDPEPVALELRVRWPRAHAPRRSFALALARPRRPPCRARPGALSVSARTGTGAGAARCIGLGHAQ